MGKNNIISGFKKFSELNEKKESNSIKPDEENAINTVPDNLPMNPNLSKKETKVEVPASTKEVKPELDKENVNVDNSNDNQGEFPEGLVETYGKVARFPKNVKANKAYNFLENVKVPKKSIWYMMIEKQDNELQMVKYNYKEGVNLAEFVSELKKYYVNGCESEAIREKINNMGVSGNKDFSIIHNIPLVEINGKKMITKITEDLIKLLNN